MTESAGYPQSRKAWALVGLLTVTYILSYADRYALYLLVEPIKQDLGLSDTEMGWLIGPAFGVLYAVSGLFAGMLADRRSRTRIIAAGVALWSAAMTACGLSRSFTQLFVARMTVGVGESTLSPCAMSMIADSFPPDRRGRPIALYSVSLSFGAGLSSLLGGLLLTWLSGISSVSVPLLGELAAWQLMFVMLGLPGLLLSLVFLFWSEPRRMVDDSVFGDAPVSLADTLRYIQTQWQGFALVFGLFAAMLMIAFTHGWHAALFQRAWGWSAAQYALANGAVLLLFGPASGLLAGSYSDRLMQRGMRDAPIRIALAGMALIVPTEILKSLAPTGEWALVTLAVNTVGFAMMSAVGVTALLNMTPARVKARTVALYYMVTSLLGSFVGPTTVGWFNDQVFTSAEGIRYSMMVLPIALGVPVLLIGPVICRAFIASCRAREAAAA